METLCPIIYIYICVCVCVCVCVVCVCFMCVGGDVCGDGGAIKYVFNQPGRKKEIFYLTTHSTHFVYGYRASDIWKSTTQIVRGNPLPPHGLLFPISSKGSFICTIPQTG